MRSHLALLLCALAATATPVLAAEGGDPPAQVAPDTASEGGGLRKIFGAIFTDQKPKSVDAVSFDTTPPAATEAAPPPPPPLPPPAVAAKPTRTLVRIVVMPLPRLRPDRPINLGTAAVSYETTASIPVEPPESPPAAAASVEPPPVTGGGATAAPRVVYPSTTAPEPLVAAPSAQQAPPQVDDARAAASDGLLGDVTTYLAPDNGEMKPSVTPPDVVDLQMPPPGGGESALPPDLAIPLNAAPFQLVRTLQSVQDRIAQGVPAAVVAQRALLVEIDRQFAAAPPAAWQDRRNAEAAVTYVLSGGIPTILERLSSMDPKPAVDTRLVTGVLAYANGHEPEAFAALGSLNPLELPASMAAQIALAQSALAVRTDPKNAMRLLSLARLLAPGTLVEEAAIRRQLFVATQLKDNDMVESLARQYLDRFRHSVYAGNFRQRFAAAISQMDIDSEANFARIDDMLSTVEAAARCQLYLTIASASIVQGHYTAGRLAAERAATFSSANSPEEAQARLYGAAALAADPKGFDTATADMGGVNRALLGPSDQALYEMVAATLEGIRSGTLRDSMPKAADLPPSDEDPAATAIAKRAADAIKSADDLLKVASQ